MKPDRPVHDEERELMQLFDATADKPSGPTLTKLSARAADVPARVKRRPRWRSLLFWAPGMAAAVAALVFVLSPSLKHSRAGAVASSPTHPALVARVPEKLAKVPAAPATPAAPVATEGSDSADLAAAFDDSDATATAAISLDPLYGPSQDDDLDAWLYATNSVLKTGG